MCAPTGRGKTGGLEREDLVRSELLLIQSLLLLLQSLNLVLNGYLELIVQPKYAYGVQLYNIPVRP